MKQTSTKIAFLLFFTALHLAGNAQTYNITTNTNTSIMGASGFSTCTNCIFNITPGVTLTINTGGTCTDCTFNGGTVNIASSSSVTWNNTNTFNNDTVLINRATTFSNVSFNNDSVAVNAPLTQQNNTATISGSRLRVAANMTFNAVSFSTSSRSTFTGASRMTVNNAMTINASSFYLHNTSSIITATGSIQNGSTIVMDGTSATNLLQFSNALPINNSTVIISGSARITASTITMSSSTFTASGSNSITSGNNFDPSGSTVSLSGSTTVTAANSTFTNSTLTMGGTASLTITNILDLKTTAATLNGNSVITTNDHTTLESNSSMIIGDGTLPGTAHLYSNNALQVLDNSQMRISNGNNYLNSNSSTFHGGTTDYTINPNTISCNQGAVTGNAHSCTAKMVYGCATLNKSGALACIILAVADINLTTTAGIKGSVDLSWSDAASSAATEYRVERSSDAKSWTNLGTVMAGGYSTTGDYTFSDAGAPAGTLYYRISRIDKDGQSLYSGISTIAITSSSASVRIYPNPTTGRNFFIAAPTTGQLVVNVYTMTGQLLTQTQLKGQTQYAMQLPAQVPAGSAVVVVVRAASQSSSQTFTLLVR